MSSRFGIASDRVFLHNSHKPALVVVEEGLIIDVLDRRTPLDAPVVDVGSLLLMPALVDTNVHTADPGRAHWEGYATATAAAAAGGVSAIIDMPQASDPPVVTGSAIIHKHSATAGVSRVDIGLWGGIVPGNLPETSRMAAAGVFGFACFLGPTGFEHVDPLSVDDLDAALRAAHAVSRPLLVRAELPWGDPPGRTYRDYLMAHPPEAELEAITAVVDAVRRTGAWAHILGLSTAEALPMLAAARTEGLLVTVETCPHHLVFTADQIGPEDTLYACAPPIRGAANREGLWQGLADGVIDMIVSDHAPTAPSMRTRSFSTTMPGIASLELRLPAVWTEARRRGFVFSHLVQWLSRAPAALGRIPTGKVEPGRRADLIAWDPDAEFVVDPSALHQRHGATPYAGHTLRGVIHRTWSAGRLVYANGRLMGKPLGEILRRS